MSTKKHRCPLCKSILSKQKFLSIIGEWEDISNKEKKLQKKIIEISKQRKLLNRQIEKEARKSLIKGLEEGRKKEKMRSDKLANEMKQKEEEFQKRIKQLEDHLKNGTTAQTAGFNFEKQLEKELKEQFPTDEIKRHGKGGDLLHKIILGKNTIGSILYECKKTNSFKSSYVKQVKKDKAERNATYGILVTLSSKKKSMGFCVEDDIIIVHPHGAIHVAELLRKSLIEVHSLKANRKEVEKRTSQLMDFVKSDEFKNAIQNTVSRMKELIEILRKEEKAHEKCWKLRSEHYNKVKGNIFNLSGSTNEIINGINKKKPNKANGKLLSLRSVRA